MIHLDHSNSRLAAIFHMLLERGFLLGTSHCEKPLCAARGGPDFQSRVLFFPSFARHSFGPANKFAATNKFVDPSKDSSPLTQNQNYWFVLVSRRETRDVMRL